MSYPNFPQLARLVALAAVTTMFLIGCSRSIGDECETDSECPTGAICDITVPNGYCMSRTCERNECPAGAVCVRFDEDTRHCMQFCEVSNECREDLTCRQDIGSAGFCYLPGS